MSGIIVGIAGCTNSGKSTIRDKVRDQLSSEFHCKIATLSQDDFFKQKQHVRQLKNNEDQNITFYHYDEAFSVEEEKLRNELKQMQKSFDLIIVDGNMLTELPTVLNLFHTVIFLTLDYETCKQRRVKRTDYDPPDEIGYFDQIVWGAYEDHLKFAQSLNDPRIEFMGGNDSNVYSKFLSMTKNAICDQIRIQKEVIDVDSLCTFVTSPEYGAISVFIGTTRDFFDNKKVKLLEYECYEEMAMSEMFKLCHETRHKYPNIGKIAITHRIDRVSVTEKSVVIATSSPHRIDAIRATEFLIDKLKEKVPIWKKEIYENDQSVWKENAESIRKN